MTPVTYTNILWFRLGSSLADVVPAPSLVEDMADLADYWRNLLRSDSTVIDATIELQGFAPVHVKFKALCPTVALTDFPSFNPNQQLSDAGCLLVNGLEGREDIKAVKAAVNFPPQIWAEIQQATKPMVAAVFNVNGRMRDPATTTIIHVVSNVYFNMFGTNSVERRDLT